MLLTFVLTIIKYRLYTSLPRNIFETLNYLARSAKSYFGSNYYG